MGEATPFRIEPPIDTAELVARARFTLDEPTRVTEADARERRDVLRVLRNQRSSKSLLVTRTIMPAIAEMIEQVASRLLLNSAPKVYVELDPMPNAAALVSEDESIVILASTLVELLETDELAAIVGHEFGHTLFGHAPTRMREGPSANFHLERSRASEVSADRVGLIAAGSLATAIRAEVKMACGLSSRHLNFDIDAIVRESEALMLAAEQHEGTIASTHPEFPFRIWALSRFAQSDLFASVSGGSGGTPIDEIERDIEDHFAGIGEGDAFVLISDFVHESLAWMGILIVAEDSEITAMEREALVLLVGTIWAEDVSTYAKRHGLEAVRRRALKSLRPLAHAGIRTRRRLEESIREFEKKTGAKARCAEMLKLIDEAIGQ